MVLLGIACMRKPIYLCFTNRTVSSLRGVGDSHYFNSLHHSVRSWPLKILPSSFESHATSYEESWKHSRVNNNEPVHSTSAISMQGCSRGFLKYSPQSVGIKASKSLNWSRKPTRDCHSFNQPIRTSRVTLRCRKKNKAARENELEYHLKEYVLRKTFEIQDQIRELERKTVRVSDLQTSQRKMKEFVIDKVLDVEDEIRQSRRPVVSAQEYTSNKIFLKGAEETFKTADLRQRVATLCGVPSTAFEAKVLCDETVHNDKNSTDGEGTLLRYNLGSAQEGLCSSLGRRTARKTSQENHSRHSSQCRRDYTAG